MTSRVRTCAALVAALLVASGALPGAACATVPERTETPVPTQAQSAVQQITTGDGVVLRVRTAHDSVPERQTVEQLRRILSRHALVPWIGTRELLVESGAIPHSDPVLTLDTSYLDDDTGQLASFVHEQFHWYLGNTPERLQALGKAIDALSRLFPDAPTEGPEGAMGRHSTLLHLVVCDMELQAMEVLVGREQARRELAGKHFYRWIYRQVLENPAVSAIVGKYGLDVPANPQPPGAGIRGSAAGATPTDART